MAQFDVYRNDTGFGPRIPFLIDVQADFFSDIASRIVLPLQRTADVRRPLKHLNPIIELNGERFVVVTQDLFNTPIKGLGEKVGSLESHSDQLIRAIDFIILGF
ncbi:MAG: CcdB family protein [Sphingomonadales bacterium]